MRSRLYLVLESPFESDTAEKIAAFSGGAPAAVLLVEDGVLYAVHSEKRKALKEKNLRILANRTCLTARGFGEFQHEDVEVVDYDKTVDLIMDEYDGVIRL